MKYYLFCAVRNKKLVNQTIAAMASILSWSPNKQEICFVIVTNFKQNFTWLLENNSIFIGSNIVFEQIDEGTLKNWVGLDEYIYRVKIKSIQLFFQRYHADVLFLDSDNFIRGDLEQLHQKIQCGRLILYSKAGKIQDNKDQILKQYPNIQYAHKTLVLKDFTTNEPFLINTDRYYFTSCVIGIPYKYQFLAEEVLYVCDVLYHATKFRTAEELAFSLVMAEYGEISTALTTVGNYSYREYLTFFLKIIYSLLLDDDKDYSHFFEAIDINALLMHQKRFDKKDLTYIDLVINASIKHKPISKRALLEVLLAQQNYFNNCSHNELPFSLDYQFAIDLCEKITGKPLYEEI